jgi:superfamily I DNA/RNA helicase
MNEQWLTENNAVSHGNLKLTSLKQSAPSSDVIVSDEQLASTMMANNEIRRRLMGSVFLSAIGIEWPGKPPERQSWFISSAMLGGFFAGDHVVGWTHWMGSVATRLREGFERGAYPTELLCGPEGRQFVSKVGPLVLYNSRDGRMINADFIDSRTLRQRDESPTLDDFPEGKYREDDDSGAGLKSIVTTFDTEQDDIVRGPRTGAFLYYGGPGTGKTTLALHRIPYLIMEQGGNVPSASGIFDGNSSSPGAEPFFTASKTLVVVWKEHLVQYLRESISKLNMGFTLPEANVAHIDRWVTDTLRPYVKIGGKTWRLDSDPDSFVETQKAKLSEVQLKSFLNSGHAFHRAALDAFSEALPKSFSDLLSRRLDELRQLPRNAFSYPTPLFTAASFERSTNYILDQLPETNEVRFSQMQNSEIRTLRSETQESRAAAFAQLSRYDELLFEFYRSDVVTEMLPQRDRGEWLAAVAKQQSDKKLSRSDTYLLIWLIYLVTEGSKTKKSTVKPLPEYTHIIVDEAQYYQPLLLRLFGRLVALPHGVLTIVGDLEQRFAHSGGVADWKEIGIEFPASRRCHLQYNYRWTPELFEFLQRFHAACRIKESLTRPYRFRVDGGFHPEVRRFGSSAEEHEAIADRITDLKEFANSQGWTYAIFVPDALHAEAQRELIPLLKQRFVQAQWEEGSGVLPTVDRVIVCGLDCIVGLEFDCVFAMGIEVPVVTASHGPDLGIWVGLTRAQKFLHITVRGEVGILDQKEFASFRVPEPVEPLVSDDLQVLETLPQLSFSSLGPEDWFSLAAWAKAHNLLTGWERQFCYSQGIRVRSGREPSDREAEKAQEIMDRAVRIGFCIP